MKYRNKKVKNVDTTALLFEIIQRNELDDAPIEIKFGSDFKECMLAIGKNNIASIYLDVDDIDALKQLVAEHEN